MSDITATIDTYLAAYGETDPASRRRLLEQSFAPSATLADPPFDATGLDAIDATFAAVQGQFPGHTFRRTSAVDSHHGAARYGWELVGTDGAVAVAGVDFVRLGNDGLLVQVAGFFGPLPELAS